MNNFIYNNTKRKIARRHLRRQMTTEELILWQKLRRKQIGYIFRRQYSIGPYIVDFYCPSKRLVVEVDGKQHVESKDYDSFRTSYLNSLSISVLRFWNWQVTGDLEKVIETIKDKLDYQ